MWWAGNQSITSEQFDALYRDFLKHAEGMTLFAQDLHGGRRSELPDQDRSSPNSHGIRCSSARC